MLYQAADRNGIGVQTKRLIQIRSENPKFAEGTKAVMQAIVEATAAGATSVIGGGDSVSAAKKFAKAEDFTHVSTGGGASLEFIEGKVLPGVDALDD